MFEYANVGALVVLVAMGVLALVINKSKKNKRSSGLGFIGYVLIVAFILLVWDSYSKYTGGKARRIYKVLKMGCKKRSKPDTYDTFIRTPKTVSFGQ